MNKEELLQKYYENVEYLRRNIPPDDIYLFTEQTFMAAMFFLKKWSDCENIRAEMARCTIADKWVKNILNLAAVRERKIDLPIDLNIPE